MAKSNYGVQRSAFTGQFVIKEGHTVRGGITSTATLANRPPPPAPNKTPPSEAIKK
jgi:hypothetical protein